MPSGRHVSADVVLRPLGRLLIETYFSKAHQGGTKRASTCSMPGRTPVVPKRDRIHEQGRVLQQPRHWRMAHGHLYTQPPLKTCSQRPELCPDGSDPYLSHAVRLGLVRLRCFSAQALQSLDPCLRRQDRFFCQSFKRRFVVASYQHSRMAKPFEILANDVQDAPLCIEPFHWHDVCPRDLGR